MKKVLFTLLIVFSFIRVLNASDYSCEITGSDVLYSNSDEISFINVNIKNIEEILSFRMYIKFDNKLYNSYLCQFLNYTTPGCSLRVNDQSIIFYDYNFNDDYSLNDYPFYYASFKSNENTPSTGKTTIKVSFEDVKDKNNNIISIDSCKKTILFEEGTGKENIISNSLNIDITGYDFDFDENVYEYKLKVEEDVNNLNINVKTPDNYKVSVNGASDLNSSGNKVIIIVKDENDEENEYVINVIRDKSDIKTTDIEKDVKKTVSSIKSYLPFILVFIIIIIIVLLIVHKKDNKKMDKYLDNL